jgi:hypothetical protein
MKTTPRLLLWLLLIAPAMAQESAPMVIHEWGTITSRHRPDGTAEGKLNKIEPDAVLPGFVHSYEPPQTNSSPDRVLTKSPAVPGRPDVTMRLETPVIYFYPPKGSKAVPFDVSVSFRGGVLNEFYPKAEASVAVDDERIRSKMEAKVLKWDGNVLNNFVVGTLFWKDVRLTESVTMMQTDQNAWLAPRSVKASDITTGGEGERYLFYRGVAHLDALFQTRRMPAEVILNVPAQLHWLQARAMTVPQVWLVEVREKGLLAYREQKSIRMTRVEAGHELFRLPLFSDRDFTPARAVELKSSMKQALTAMGLFGDEAEAMLATWNESYFQKPGLRIFYIVPKEWIDYHLPLQVSVPNRMTRVLVGRIDLVGQP